MAKELIAKFRSKCSGCKQTINVGEPAWWERSKVIYHASCRPGAATVRPEAPAARRDSRYRPHTGPTTYSTHFDSWTQFVDTAANGHSEMNDNHRSSRDTSKEDWTGTATFSDAIALASNGWEAELPRVESFTSDILGKLQPTLDTAFHSYYDVQGCEVDIGRFMSGDPECMIDLAPVKVSRVGRVISIHVQLNINWMVNVVDLLKRGAAIVALVDILHQLQHSVEITAEFLMDDLFDKGRTSSFTIDLKRSSDPLDIANLIFAIAHPSTHRRLMFSLMEQQSATYRKEFGVPGSYAMNVSDIASDADIVLTKADHITNGKVWIIEHLTRFGLMEDSTNE